MPQGGELGFVPTTDPRLVYVAVAVAVLGVLSALGWRNRHSKHDLYQTFEPVARYVKIMLQMAIGATAVAAIGWQAWNEIPDRGADHATGQLLGSIGLALAASAVVELAYTLFTDGPDEALDPLMLAISATMIVEVGKADFGLRKAAALAILGLLLALLFAVRLFLSERHETHVKRTSKKKSKKDKRDQQLPPTNDINIWWVRLLTDRLCGRGPVPRQSDEPHGLVPTAPADPTD
jgi:hypothetical protein